jgi:uncharacterized protein YqeY
MSDSLKNRIQEDMKAAMRAKEAVRLTTIRLLLAAIKQREVDERITLQDPEIINIINKMIKQRLDSIAQFEVAKRIDLVNKEQAEIDLLKMYLPEQLTGAQVDAAIQKALDETQAKAVTDIGKVMALLKNQLTGRADMAAVSVKVKERLK